MTVEFGSASLWGVIIAIAVGIYVIRVTFIHLNTDVEELPPIVERGLTFVPAAIITAIIFPDLFVVPESVGGLESMVAVVVNPHSIAAGVGAVVAWRTNSMVATVAVGMVTLWGILFLVG